MRDGLERIQPWALSQSDGATKSNKSQQPPPSSPCPASLLSRNRYLLALFTRGSSNHSSPPRPWQQQYGAVCNQSKASRGRRSQNEKQMAASLFAIAAGQRPGLLVLWRPASVPYNYTHTPKKNKKTPNKTLHQHKTETDASIHNVPHHTFASSAGIHLRCCQDTDVLIHKRWWVSSSKRNCLLLVLTWWILV